MDRKQYIPKSKTKYSTPYKLYSTTHLQTKNEPTTTKINIKERYFQAYKKYVSSQFTYNSHCLVRKLCQNAQKEPNLYNVPLYKIMIEITKIMMMNQLELLFFGATVQQMGWKKVEEPCLNDYIGDVIDITPKITDKGDFVKKLQLSLLLIAYIVKIYLNEESALYDFKIRDLAKNNFQKMYQQWVQKVQNHFKFSPKHMNKLFKQLDKGKSTIKEDIVDYNQLVSKLFENSRDQEQDYYAQRQVQQHSYKVYEKEKQKQQNCQSGHGHKIDGLTIRQQEDLQPPSFPGRTFSSRSHVSGIGKRQSLHQLFGQGQLKPERGISQFDEDFLGNGL